MNNNIYDDEDEFSQINPNNFDPDSVIGEDENFATLDAFLMHLQELKDKPHIQMINPVRYKEFCYACKMITKAVMAENPDSKIEYSINDCGIGEGNIEITADDICAKDLKGFISGLKFANNFEVYPLVNDNIKMNILFHDVMVSANLEQT